MTSSGVCFGYQCACIVGCSRSICSSIVVITPDVSFWVVPVLHSVSDMTDAESIRLYSHRRRISSRRVTACRSLYLHSTESFTTTLRLLKQFHCPSHTYLSLGFSPRVIRTWLLVDTVALRHDSRRTSIFPRQFSAQAHVTKGPSDGVVPRSSLIPHSWGLGVWGCHSSVVEDYNILEFDAVSTGR